ncbi:MAG: transglutaminase domain-containing protein [Bdellovibrionaceae bacterium]|nr:transglutaminase domain-containing protein [Pseudobdellovibrionaceae bacterium]
MRYRTSPIFAIVLVVACYSKSANAWSLFKSDPIEAVRQQCIEKHEWKTVQCSIKNEHKYQIQAMTDPFDDKSTATKSPDERLAGSQRRQKLLSTIRDKALADNLNTCQVFALAKCATSQFLTYDDSLIPYFTEPIEMTYFHSRGNCRQFATIFHDITSALNLKSEVISGFYNNSGLHAFNLVYLDGYWVYTEPQTPEPDFYNPKSIKFMKNWKNSHQPSLFLFLNQHDQDHFDTEERMNATILPTRYQSNPM